MPDAADLLAMKRRAERAWKAERGEERRALLLGADLRHLHDVAPDDRDGRVDVALDDHGARLSGRIESGLERHRDEREDEQRGTGAASAGGTHCTEHPSDRSHHERKGRGHGDADRAFPSEQHGRGQRGGDRDPGEEDAFGVARVRQRPDGEPADDERHARDEAD
jgi:hypothetical protein